MVIAHLSHEDALTGQFLMQRFAGFGNDLKTCNIVAGILLLLGHVKPPPLTFNATSSQNALQRTENRSMLFTQLQFLRSSIDHSKPDWNDDEKRTLINFYNENQCLWNHQLKDYHDKGGGGR